MDFLLLIRVAVIALIPVLIKKYRKITYDAFDLTNLTKMISFMFIYYTLMNIVVRIHDFTPVEYFVFAKVMQMAITTVLIFAMLKYSPIRNAKESIILPIVNKKSSLFAWIIALFANQSFSIYWMVAHNPEKIFQAHKLMFYAVLGKPLMSILIIVVFGLYAVIGEEMVFRYFVINSLKPVFSERSIILSSSLIWALLHQHITINNIILGMILAYLYIKTESLSLCILLHYVSNISIFSSPFYVYFSNSNIIKLTSLQYALMIFIAFILVYISAEFIFKRTRFWKYV